MSENNQLVTGDDATLKATNHLRGGINVIKKVVDENGKEVPVSKTKDLAFTVQAHLSQDGNAIKEGARPAGYISTETDVFYIRVDGSGVHIIQKDMTKAPSDWQIVTSYPHNDLVAAFAPAAGEEPAAVTVVNQKGAALPSTGGTGTGTGMLYLFGIILTGLAGAGLVMKKRRRNAA